MHIPVCLHTCVDHMSAAEASSRSAALVAPPLAALLRLKAASERPSALVPGSHAMLLSAGKSDCERKVVVAFDHLVCTLGSSTKHNAFAPL